MKKYMIYILLAAALLQGCSSIQPPVTDPSTTTAAPTTDPPVTTTPPATTNPPVTTAPPATTAPPTTTVPPTTQPTEPPTTTPPETTVPIGDVDPELFADLTAKLGEPTSWYNMALTCEYTSPAEINLMRLFYNGFDDETTKPTEQEYPLLKAMLTHKNQIDYMDLVRLPVSKMDAVLTEYFGIQTKDINENGMLYLEETKCYYMLLNAANYALISEFTGAEKLEDGSIRIFYTESRKEYAVTLKPFEDRYIIWSNLSV